MEGINERILWQYRPDHDFGSQRIDLIAERHKRYSGQITKPLLSAVRLADASLVNDILRRHEFVPMAVDAPPLPSQQLTWPALEILIQSV